jgi:putative membrane protein
VLGVPIAGLIQALIVPAFATVAAGRGVTLGFFAVIGVIGLVARLLDWQRRLFSFDGEYVRVDSGIVSRSHRSLDVARIQQVELQRGPVQRLCGLATLRIETAGGAAEPEVDLRVLELEDALALRNAVRVVKARLAGGDELDEDPPEPEPEAVLEVPMRHVVIGSITGARLLVLPAVIGGLLQFAGQQFGAVADRFTDVIIEQGLGPVAEGVPNVTDWRLIALTALGVTVLAVLAAIAVGLVRDGRFRIERIDEDLHVSRGLISTRESVVPLRRVQLVEIQRNWLRRLLGYSTLRIRSAGGSTGGDGRVTVPLLHDTDIDRLLGEILPGVDAVPALTSHPRAALRRAVVRWLRPALTFIGAVWLAPVLVPFLDTPLLERARWAVLALIPINIVLAVVEYRHLAHGLSPRVIAARRGALSITTTVAPVVKAQAVSTHANWFQRRLRLATLVVHIAGPGASVGVLDAHEDDAADLHTKLAEHAASPIPIEIGAEPADTAEADPGARATAGTG